MSSFGRAEGGSANFAGGASEDETAAFLSRPQLYGGFGGFPQEVKNSVFLNRGQRHKINIIPVCQCLLVPWIMFCLLYAVKSFQIHYNKPTLCGALVMSGLVTVIATGLLAVRAIRQKFMDDPSRTPSWFIFLFLTTLVAFVLAVVLGDLNFWTNMKPYFDYTNLNEHHGIDPARMRGQQLMDAGRVFFTENATLELRRSMGFVNLDTYCVAPITVRSGSAGELMPLASYDFWAVGLGCCSGNVADFHCGDFNNPRAHSGLRLLHDEQRAFYRLAVQQAEATYGIKATHPLFFHWGEDATAEMETFRDEGIKYYLIGMIVHFWWQLLCVGLAVAAFSKLGH